ncbi:hypothetical protein TNIN_252871 [Trichonephila inaurata madagascariensis]|uniref:Uncharacterized protein n=1 Tax=Trichonephila inaurata madagascariensis TaxID=2747483 RepID=A0A8X6MA67_9ARAC|nr:hypothetical protein TNIN_50011 [Trichonephila inaurata madagascariensis]GFY56692.1 hypothetical protein TNIN_252871 [Trichonephila inaurata madagascariensis]
MIYTSLLGLIPEDRYQIYLQKIDKTQLSIAHIIAELYRSIPTNRVLYEADLQSLRPRSIPTLTICYSKLFSYQGQHRTAHFLRS